MTPSQAREITLRRFAEWQIDANDSLPLLDSREALAPQSGAAVAARAVSIGYVIGLYYKADPKEVVALLESYGLWDAVPKSERSLLQSRKIRERDRRLIGYLPESAQVLAWALRLAELNHLAECDDTLAQKFPFKTDPEPFIEGARLRAFDEILQEADTLYMLHWAAVHAVLRRDIPPVDPYSARFRRHAIDWVLGEGDWDAVPLDT